MFVCRINNRCVALGLLLLNNAFHKLFVSLLFVVREDPPPPSMNQPQWEAWPSASPELPDCLTQDNDGIFQISSHGLSLCSNDHGSRDIVLKTKYWFMRLFVNCLCLSGHVVVPQLSVYVVFSQSTKLGVSE